MKSFISDICRKFPVFSSLVFVLVFVSAIMVPLDSIICVADDIQTNGYLIGAMQQTLVGMLAFVLWKKLNINFNIGISSSWRQVWLYWPIILFSILDFLEVLSGERILDWEHPQKIICYVLVYMSTGLIEEVLCRGLILSVLLSEWKDRKGGIYGAVVISALLFGLPHIVNYWAGKVSLTAMTATIIYATMIGVYFAACVIRTDNLLSAILVHGFVDITGSTKEIEKGFQIANSFYDVSVEKAVIQVLLMMPLFIAGLWLLRKSACQNVLNFEKI